jgi:8-amino-7-oxononanoate synthase
MESPAGAKTIINGREMDYFGGSGYLGLQNHPDVISAAHEAMEMYGFSTATSRGGFGEVQVYAELERQACAYFSAEKVLHYASGYMGTSILTQSTGNLFDHVFIDSSAHFSLWDAAYATNMPITPFHHLRPESLSSLLKTELHNQQRPLILSDGVFPVTGEIAPLPDYLLLVRDYGGLVYIDDAHAVGVLGENGRGTPEYFNLSESSDFRTSATLAKALGGFGGIIWGDAKWIDRIDRNSRITAGASPPPIVVAAASAKAIEIARTHPQLVSRLRENAIRLRHELGQLGWDLAATPVPIICLESRQGVSIERLSKDLLERNIAVELVRSYTSTPPGGAIRIAVFATHTAEQIDRLIDSIRRIL